MNLFGMAWFISKRSEAHNDEGETQVAGAQYGCAGTCRWKEGIKQVLAGLASFSQTVGTLFRVIHEQTKHSS
jgi:hypothetical protein